jgi:hypothetical protein
MEKTSDFRITESSRAGIFGPRSSGLHKMLMSGQKLILFIGLLPYLSLAAYDGWLHEKARRVPMPEQCFHALLAISLSVLIWGLFSHHPEFSIPSLCVFTAAALIDEMAFHKSLAAFERKLHHIAYVCFALFIALAFWLKAFS